MSDTVQFMGGDKYGGVLAVNKADGTQEIVYIHADEKVDIQNKRYGYNRFDDTFSIEDINE